MADAGVSETVAAWEAWEAAAAAAEAASAAGAGTGLLGAGTAAEVGSGLTAADYAVLADMQGFGAGGAAGAGSGLGAADYAALEQGAGGGAGYGSGLTSGDYGILERGAGGGAAGGGWGAGDVNPAYQTDAYGPGGAAERGSMAPSDYDKIDKWQMLKYKAANALNKTGGQYNKLPGPLQGMLAKGLFGTGEQAHPVSAAMPRQAMPYQAVAPTYQSSPYQPRTFGSEYGQHAYSAAGGQQMTPELVALLKRLQAQKGML